MAPDLNSLSSTARPNPTMSTNSSSTNPSSRRTTQTMPPPPLPQGGSHTRRMSNSSATSESTAPQIPLRHPRPMTPAELHSDMEKEQEGIVNRLSRELSALRAHSASVASTSSNSSYAVHDGPEPSSSTHPSHSAGLTGPPHAPLSHRRHRGSSSSSYSNPPPLAPPGQIQPVPIGATSQASVDRARDAAAPMARSRQNSTIVPTPLQPQHSGGSSSRPSPSPSPGLRHSHPFSGEGAAYFPPPSHAGARPTSVSMSSSNASLHGHAREGSGVSRVEDAAAARGALDQARLENEALVRRVKELERELRRTRRARDSPEAAQLGSGSRGPPAS